MGLSYSRSWWASYYAKGSPLPKDQRLQLTLALTHNPAKEDLRNLEIFCHRSGLDIHHIHLSGRSAHVSGTVENLNRAFKIELKSTSEGYHGHQGDVCIPENLKSVVLGVLGLSNHPVAKPYLRRSVNDNSGGYYPTDIAKLYNFPEGDGAGQTISLIELGGGYRQIDLDTYFKKLNIDSPTVVAVSVDHATNKPTNNPDGPDGEVVLDIEIAASIAPKAKIVVYFTPNTEKGFYDAIIQAINDDHNKPDIISISWGGPEDTWSSHALQSMDAAFEQAAGKNITVCVAAGDNGSGDGEKGTHVDFPASSPYVLACGGTRITVQDGKIVDEVVWDNNSKQSATGGGVSEVFELPDYQDDAHVPPSVNPGHHIGRGLPDVSANADPQMGYKILIDGQEGIVGGTSAVAPLYAALFARINSLMGRNVGFFNLELYQPHVEACFNNITKGTNGEYKAAPGWNCCCGFGSVRGVALLNALKPSEGQWVLNPVHGLEN